MRRFIMSSGFGWVLVAGLSACATIPTDVSRTARADLSCPDVEVTKLASGRYGASGCGKGAVYAEVCDASGCRVGRLRHGHEVEIGQRIEPPTQAAPREVIAAPGPEQRDVLPAPAAPDREILPAPAPAGASAESSGGESSAAPAPQTPVPLSQGDLSAPYEAEVPAAPTPQMVNNAPPEPLVEDRPSAPAPTYVWVGGYWWWGTSNWLWVPGYWCSPMVGYSYMPGYWYWSVGYWNYWPGGWGYPGSTVIVHTVAPRPRNVVTVRAFQPRVQARPTVAVTSGVRATAGTRPGAAPRPGFSPRSSPLMRYPVPNSSHLATISGRNNSSYGALGGKKAHSGSPAHLKSGANTSPGYRASPNSVGKVVKPSSIDKRPTYSGSIQRSAPMPRPSVSRSPVMRSAPQRMSPAPRMAPMPRGGGGRR